MAAGIIGITVMIAADVAVAEIEEAGAAVTAGPRVALAEAAAAAGTGGSLR